jgi:GTP-binding protein
MAVSKVAIVGRPNVGKSSIFNWLAGRRLAIVDDMAGVTRDRLMTLIEHNGRFFELIDTGGMGIQDVDNLTSEVERQIAVGIEEADLLLFVVDTRSGMTSLDQVVAERLRKVDKPVLLIANKADYPGLDIEAEEFHKLGRGWLLRISVLQNRHKEDLLDAILERLPDIDYSPEAAKMKIAIVGRRNVGKSTFVNTLARAERCIVSEVPGTTRDSVDVHFELDGQTFIAIDTPGLRRQKSVRTDIDFYGTHRAQRSIRRADVVLHFLDCSQGISKVDKQLSQYIEDNYKPCVFVVNKWDLLKDQMPTDRWVRYLRQNFPKMSYAPIAFVTGQTGKNVKSLLNHAQMLYKQAQTRVTTASLNRLVQAAIKKHEPPLYSNKRPRIYYATQITAPPPTIVAMCNIPEGFSPSYRRYLMGILRDYLPFGEVPIKVYFQKRQSVEEGAKRSREEGAPDMSQVQVYAFDDDGNPIDPNEQIRQDSAEYESEDFLEEEFAEEFEEDEMQEEEFAEDEVVEIKGYDQHPDMPGKVELPDEESPDEESPDEESPDEESPSEPPSSKKPSSEKPTE